MHHHSFALSLGAVLLCANAAYAKEYPLTHNDITVRDPFIHADETTKTYYLYAQTGNRGKSKASTSPTAASFTVEEADGTLKITPRNPAK